MKNGLSKLLLILTLAFALVISLASCDALGNGNVDRENSSNNGGAQEHEHFFGPWMTTKPATCTEKGEDARVCGECGFRESRALDITDHDYVNSKCKICGASNAPTLPGGSTSIVDIGKMDSFDYSKVPAYSGNEYVTVNENKPFFTENEKVTESYETYGSFDSLGRCTVTEACIGKDLMPTGDRTNTSFQPTGWIQAQYSFMGADALYNRCHLIAWQLTAETTNKQNLITGTRYMNEAMIPFENMVAKYIKETDNHVMYRATPIFIGDNLLASGVLLEAYSVEDNGDGICFNIFLYNVQPGVIIEYATGASRAENPEAEVVPECDYVVNKSNKKIHTPDCHNAKAISATNKWYYTGDLESLLAQNYVKAGCCLSSAKSTDTAVNSSGEQVINSVLAEACRQTMLDAYYTELIESLLENSTEAIIEEEKQAVKEYYEAA